MTSEFSFKPIEEIQERDAIKKELAKAKDITLIIVPCWWDGTLNRFEVTSRFPTHCKTHLM